jgi:hypothetical protein
MFGVILLVAAFIAFGLSKLRLTPKAHWMEIGFALAAGAAIIELAFPSH